MPRPFLTVLTAPIPTTGRRLYQGVRRRVRPLVKPGVPLPKTSPYPGHYAVVRSLVEGLRAIDADFNFNPRRTADLARVVYAPENASLLQAAEFKRRGRIDYLVAGPVNALFPDEAGGVLQLPEIDRLIVASEWVHALCADAPRVLEKSVACPAGIDARYWQRSRPPGANSALVFWKSGGEAFCEQVEQTVRACGLEPRRLRASAGEHALFGPDDYRELLEESQLAVFLSAFETQGLALAEAWSMDVPTAIWDPQGEAEWRGRTFQAGSSAPYLTEVTGRRWRSLDELEPVLRGMLAERAAFQPRAWVLAHMTDEICARELYGIIRSGAAAMSDARKSAR